jgi:hypothetical protein
MHAKTSPDLEEVAHHNHPKASKGTILVEELTQSPVDLHKQV